MMASELLRIYLEDLRSRAEDRGEPEAAAVYERAMEIGDEEFRGRAFGEAIAVITTQYQAEGARAYFEVERLAWYRAMSEVQRVLEELSS